MYPVLRGTAFIRSKIRLVPPVPCKLKVEPCKFLSVQRFFRTRVNGAQVSIDENELSSGDNQVILHHTGYKNLANNRN